MVLELEMPTWRQVGDHLQRLEGAFRAAQERHHWQLPGRDHRRLRASEAHQDEVTYRHFMYLFCLYI